MSGDIPSGTPKWILIATGVVGLVAGIFLAVAKYHEVRKARAEADIAEKQTKGEEHSTISPKPATTTLKDPGGSKTGDLKLPSEVKALGDRMGRGSLRAFAFESYVAHRDTFGWLNPISQVATSEGDKQNATFEIVPGLANSSFVSFQAVNLPKHYLCHGDFVIRLQPWDSAAVFRANATFVMERGLTGRETVSFRASNYPQRYIRHRNSRLYLDSDERSSKFAEEASFYIVKPLAK